MAGLAARAVAEAEGDLDVRLFKNNADTHGNTYGSHENYQVSRDLDYALLTEAMVPFLVTRQIICGAGALRSGRFVLGQRSAFLRDLVSPDTTKSRPLINTRDEPLADPGRWRRLHVIAGDSNLGEATIALKWGRRWRCWRPARRPCARVRCPSPSWPSPIRPLWSWRPRRIRWRC